jgi:hypothetical protein
MGERSHESNISMKPSQLSRSSELFQKCIWPIPPRITSVGIPVHISQFGVPTNDQLDYSSIRIFANLPMFETRTDLTEEVGVLEKAPSSLLVFV